MIDEIDTKGQSPQITYRFAMASILTGGLALLLAVILLIGVVVFSLRKTLLDETRVKAELIADNISAAVLFHDKDAAEDIIGTLKASRVVIGAAVSDVEGVVLAVYPEHFSPGVSRSIERMETDYEFSLSKLSVWTPVRHQGNDIGAIQVTVTLAKLYRQVTLFAVVSVSIALLAMFIAYKLLARVRHSVRRAEQRLTYLAHIDAVTGLSNRNQFNERLDLAIGAAIESGDHLVVLLLDLDNFKQVNDTLGHQAGDELLRIIGQRIIHTLRREDMVARLGGDEFAVVLHHIHSQEETAKVCNKLVSAIAVPVPIEDHSFYVSASIGFAAFPEDGVDAKTLMRNADTAMYQAKMAGKNRFEKFRHAMDAHIQRRAAIDSHLRHAVRNGELALHYQPQLDMASSSVIGFEALLRWKCQQLGGMIPPSEFIPVAEDSGLIVEIGEWVIHQALKDVVRWNHDRQTKLRVAVNLSVRQLRAANVPELISRLLAETGAAADWLELELTESVIMENVHAQVETFHELRQLNVRLAIDDFGTGYSSMSYLKRLPIDVLKIDRSFVADLATDGSDLAIASAIVALGHSLDIHVLAEGVETAEQAAKLLAIGCDMVQGYHYARPMSIDAVEDYLARG